MSVDDILTIKLNSNDNVATAFNNIAKGKIKRFFKDNTLVNQAYIKDNKISVSDYIKSNGEIQIITSPQNTSNRNEVEV